MKRWMGHAFDVVLATALAAAFAWVLCVHWLRWPGLLANGAALLFGYVAFMASHRLQPAGSFSPIRGRKVITIQRARLRAEMRRDDADPGLEFGGVRLPSRVATKHFLVAGTTGSGKTLTLKMLMKDALPLVGTGRNHRALVYDAKHDMMAILQGIFKGAGSAPRIVLLDPFDTRGAAWKMAEDIRSPEMAEHLATMLVPEEKGASQPFFADAVRHLLSGVLKSFILTRPGTWTFANVLCVMRSEKQLRETLAACTQTRHLVAQYFSRADTFQDIFSTIATKLQRFETVAAAWEHARESVSLDQWLNGEEEFILVLGNDELARPALDAVNRVLFKRVIDLVLTQPDVSAGASRRTWFFLDELREAGCLEGLNSLLTKGRSKGACVVLGFQDIDGLEEAYGERVAREMLGQCNCKAFLKMGSERTGEWASKVIGDTEVWVQTSSNSRTRWTFAQGTVTTSVHLQTRRAVMYEEMAEFEEASLEGGFAGCYMAPGIGTWLNWYTGKDLERLVPQDDEGAVNRERRHDRELYLHCAEATGDGEGSGPSDEEAATGDASYSSDEEEWSPFTDVHRNRRGRR